MILLYSNYTFVDESDGLVMYHILYVMYAKILIFNNTFVDVSNGLVMD